MPAVPFYDDDNFRELIGDGVEVEHAGIVRPLAAAPCPIPFGHIVGAAPVTEFQLIPRAVWGDLIAYKDQQKSWLEDIVRAKVSCDDQGSLNFCHAASTIQAARDRYALMGEPVPDLAFTSVGGVVTGWRNQGGDISQDWQVLRTNGACTVDYLPDGITMPPRDRSTINALLTPSKYKTGWQANALLHCQCDGVDLSMPGKTFDALATAALLNVPCTVAYSWWSHAVTAGYRLGKKNGVYFIRNRNNWGASYGDDGFLDLAEGRGTPDWGAIANLGMTPQGA